MSTAGQTGKGEDEMVHSLPNSKIPGGDEEDIDVQNIWCKEKKPGGLYHKWLVAKVFTPPPITDHNNAVLSTQVLISEFCKTDKILKYTSSCSTTAKID